MNMPVNYIKKKDIANSDINPKIGYLKTRRMQKIDSSNIDGFNPFFIIKDTQGNNNKNILITDFTTSFTAYIDSEISSISYYGLIPIKCMLQYYPVGLDIITQEYMSGSLVYVTIYDDANYTNKIAKDINPKFIRLEPNNSLIITGARDFDSNIAIFFEVYTQ